jgi:hypothetical protein
MNIKSISCSWIFSIRGNFGTSVICPFFFCHFWSPLSCPMPSHSARYFQSKQLCHASVTTWYVRFAKSESRNLWIIRTHWTFHAEYRIWHETVIIVASCANSLNKDDPTDPIQRTWIFIASKLIIDRKCKITFPTFPHIRFRIVWHRKGRDARLDLHRFQEMRLIRKSASRNCDILHDPNSCKALDGSCHFALDIKLG